MGNCNTNCTAPTYNNVCDVSVGELNTSSSLQTDGGITSFCTAPGFIGKGLREQACQDLGPAEWEFANGVNLSPCLYSSCNQSAACTAECVDLGCTSLPGQDTVCRRTAFTGLPAPCCIKDYNRNKIRSACFSDAGQQNTCADGRNSQPNYRDCTSPNCQSELIAWCSGQDVDDDSWMGRWLDGSCTSALYTNMLNTYLGVDNPPTDFKLSDVNIPPGTCQAVPAGNISSAGYFWGTNLMREVFNKYQEQNYVLGSLPGTIGFSELQPYLYDKVCCLFPGLCQESLFAACQNYSIQELSNNPSLSNWCGCHLNPQIVDEYTTKYGVGIPCLPTCNRADSIPIVGAGQQPITCPDNICVIDDVSVNLIRNTGNANVTFANVCGGCAAGGCSCVIDNSSTDIIQSTLQNVNIDFSNACGSVQGQVPNSQTFGPALIPYAGTVDALAPLTSQDAIDNKIKQHTWYMSIGMWFGLVILLFGVAILGFIFYKS